MTNTYQSSNSVSLGKGNRTTGAQRTNARYDKIWDTYKKQQAEKEQKIIKTENDYEIYQIKKAKEEAQITRAKQPTC